LIEKGAIPIGNEWNGDIESLESSSLNAGGEQLSLFD
jgi:hypothetical protein